MDRLFGTFIEETEAPVFGIVVPLASSNPLWAQVAYWFELVRKGRELSDRRDRLRLWFARPDWPKASTRERPAPTRAKYDRSLTPSAKVYVVAQLVPVILVTFYMLLNAQGEDRTLLALGMVFVLFALFALGGLLDGRRWARPLEAARIASLALVLVAWARAG